MMKRTMTIDKGRKTFLLVKLNLGPFPGQLLLYIYPSTLNSHHDSKPSNRTLKNKLNVFPMAVLNSKINEWAFCSSNGIKDF